jgi:hypothetical protein
MYGTYVKIQFNIVFPSMRRASTWYISCKFPSQVPVRSSATQNKCERPPFTFSFALHLNK